MTAPSSAPEQVRMTMVRRVARSVLTLAVRGRGERGGDWGEALLAEFAEVRGDWAAVRWAASGLRAVWYERRRRVRQLPRHIRIGRRLALLAALALAGLAVDRYVLSVDVVLSANMEPTLRPTDRYLHAKVFFGVDRGDIVVLREGDGYGVVRIIRVIGLPGDTIACRDGQVWVNGARPDEPYLSRYPDEARTDCTEVTVPSDHLYVLGDNRAVALDSRHDGPIPRDAVQSRMLGRVWAAEHPSS